MRVSSRSFSSATFILVLSGTGALLVLLVILITGGFVIDAGPFHFSSRRWTGPLIVAAAAWIAAACAGGRQAIAHALSILDERLDRHAPAIAAVAAAATAGIGIGFGTFAASAADASGYVSQARLLADARVSFDEPLARLLQWPDATWAVAPLGYRPGPVPGEVVPTYPPGLPLTMAAARVAGGEWAPFFVVPLLGAVAVGGTFLLGMTRHSRRAGLVAAVLLATSPILLFQLVQPMSDIPALAWWTLALLCAFSPGRASPLAAGAVAGLALLARPNLLPVLLPLAWFVGRSPIPQTRRLVPFAIGLVPAGVVLASFQWRIYGSPLASGHGAFSDFFALSNVWPNVGVYTGHLVRGEAAALALALIASVVAFLAGRRAIRDAADPRLAPIAIAAAIFGGVVVLCYLPYVVFRDWFYLRFLLPAFPLALVLVGALAGRAVAGLPRPARALVLLVALTAAASTNIVVARREQAFNMRVYEGRYRSAGRYADAVLPREAVILAVQESGSARYYARPIVRWDLLAVDLDAAVATLTAMHRHPVLLVEDWEAADLQKRFPSSRIARLDWPPRTEIGTSVRVRLFDPADRESPGRVHTDRFR